MLLVPSERSQWLDIGATSTQLGVFWNNDLLIFLHVGELISSYEKNGVDVA